MKNDIKIELYEITLDEFIKSNTAKRYEIIEQFEHEVIKYSGFTLGYYAYKTHDEIVKEIKNTDDAIKYLLNSETNKSVLQFVIDFMSIYEELLDCIILNKGSKFTQKELDKNLMEFNKLATTFKNITIILGLKREDFNKRDI